MRELGFPVFEELECGGETLSCGDWSVKMRPWEFEERTMFWGELSRKHLCVVLKAEFQGKTYCEKQNLASDNQESYEWPKGSQIDWGIRLSWGLVPSVTNLRWCCLAGTRYRQMKSETKSRRRYCSQEQAWNHWPWLQNRRSDLPAVWWAIQRRGHPRMNSPVELVRIQSRANFRNVPDSNYQGGFDLTGDWRGENHKRIWRLAAAEADPAAHMTE